MPRVRRLELPPTERKSSALAAGALQRPHVSGSMSSSAGSRPASSRRRRSRSDMGAEERRKLEHARARQGGVDLLDLVAELVEQLGRVAGGRARSRVERRASIGGRRASRRRAAGPARAGAPSRTAPTAAAPRRVAELVAGEHVEQLRGVGDRARQHAVARRGSGSPSVRARARCGRACGLSPTRPQQAAGMPDRAAAVVAVRDRDHARRRPPRPARRTSRRACGACPTGCASGRSGAAR